MLTAKELATLRDVDAPDLLPDTCRIERPTHTNSYGVITASWGTAVASTACRLDPDKSRKEEMVISDRESMISRYQLTLPYNVDVRDGDRIVHNGVVYEIIELHENHSLNMFRRARVSQIRGG